MDFDILFPPAVLYKSKLENIVDIIMINNFMHHYIGYVKFAYKNPEKKE